MQFLFRIFFPHPLFVYYLLFQQCNRVEQNKKNHSQLTFLAPANENGAAIKLFKIGVYCVVVVVAVVVEARALSVWLRGKSFAI